MSQNVIQTSFNSGEWAPALNARVDLQKYHSAAALLRNYYVDYRGGASSRPGTKYILQAYKSTTAVRLIPFQASFTVGYMLEFGDQYIRFYYAGAPVLEATKAITGATKANPCVLAIATHGYSVGDWIYVTGVLGMTQLNGRYFKVISVPDANHVGIGIILDGSNVNSSGYSTYTSGGTAARVYTLASPYLASDDLFLLKYAQNVNSMVICHPDYPPYVLTLISAASWTLTAITFAPPLTAPTGMGAATTGAGAFNYSYKVTAVDQFGIESPPSNIASSTVTATASTITVSWTAVSGAQSYNVYRAGPNIGATVPTGAQFGFVSNVTGVSYADAIQASGFPLISSDFSQCPPISKNPFQGAGVASATVTSAGTYTTVPTITFAAPPAGGVIATGLVALTVQGTPTVSSSTTGWSVGDIAYSAAYGVSLVVATVAAGQVATFQPITFPGSVVGSVTTGSTPSNPITMLNRTTGQQETSVNATLTWGVGSIQIVNNGAGYTSVPAITFSSGAAAATAVLQTASAGNPTVPIFFQQRLVLAGPAGAPAQFNMSQPAAPYNFNISNPLQPDDAIQGTIVSNELNSIKAMIAMPAGLTILSDQQVWIINGGSTGSVPTAIDLAAGAQARSGCNDVRPILANLDILFVQSKGSVIRNVSYDFYKNVYAGTDVSVLSSHLFYGYTIADWAWAEEPFKLVYAVRSDGVMLNLTFFKEQELIGWAHSDTDGDFKSVASVNEAVSFGNVDAVYTVVERNINGNTVKYIERFAERIFPDGATSAWCVDAGLQYDGAPVASFTGGEHLAGETVTGLADGEVITPFVMSTAGTFTLPSAASVVTVGLAFTPQLQTLMLDIGEPTIQGKQKKIAAVTLRVADTLGLQIGMTEDTVVNMKDLIEGNVGSQTNEVVDGLVTGDAQTILDPMWTEPGQYFINQPLPYPAQILGVIPEIIVGDTLK